MAARDVSDDQLTQHWREIQSASARLHRLLDADLEAAGVPPQWYPVLELLLRSEEHRLPMSTLARELTMTSGGFSKLADRMAADGLIDRRGTTDDRRVVHATLTDAGLELAGKARAVYVDSLRRRLGPEDGSALAVVAQTLRSLSTDSPEPEPIGSGHENGTDATSVPKPTAGELLAGERDPALPDRRGRGRGSGTGRTVTGPPRSGPDAPR